MTTHQVAADGDLFVWEISIENMTEVRENERQRVRDREREGMRDRE